MNQYIDLSQPVTDNLFVYQGDTPPRLQKVNSLATDGFNNYQITSGMHAGTHIDGPMHLTESNQFINEIPIEKFIGKGVLLNASGENNITEKSEYKTIITPECIVLIYTNHAKFFGTPEYYSDYPVLSDELAELLVERKIKMLCLDSPSPDKHPYTIHKLLLAKNILIAENLTNIEKLLGVAEFEVYAFPLKITADSSPARIIARIIR